MENSHVCILLSTIQFRSSVEAFNPASIPRNSLKVPTIFSFTILWIYSFVGLMFSLVWIFSEYQSQHWHVFFALVSIATMNPNDSCPPPFWGEAILWNSDCPFRWYRPAGGLDLEKTRCPFLLILPCKRPRLWKIALVCICPTSSKRQNTFIRLEWRIKSVLELLVLTNAAQRTSQRLIWKSGA